jgi:hypothetical protein
MSPLTQYEPSVGEMDELESSSDERPHASTSNAVAFTSTPVTRTPRTVQASAPPAFAAIPLPHYTVTRSSNNSKTHPHIISVHAGVTDSRAGAEYPTRTSRGEKLGGALNWFEEQAKGDKRYMSWMEGLGTDLAERLGENQANGEYHDVLDERGS